MPILTKKTYDRRLAAMRELMQRHRLDAFVFTTADFFQWSSNFHVDVQPWERPIMLCVPLEGNPFAIMNELSIHHVSMSRERNHLWIDDISFYAEHPKVVGRLPLLSQLADFIASKLEAGGLNRSRIGCDAVSSPLSRAAAFLPEIKLIPFTSELRKLRWVKQEEELEIMRAACSLSDWLQERYRENIRPGRLVQELDCQMASLMVEEGARRFPGENLEVLRCWTLSGPASASPHGDGAPCGARIQKGDVLVNIIIPRLNGIVIENERTWFCGQPSSEQRTYFEVAKAANEAALAVAVPGLPVAGIDAAAQEVIEKAGCGQFIRHRTGHGMGILGHEFPDDMAFNYRPLLANEVYSAEPGIYVLGLGGFRLDDSVVVGATPEVMTKTPKDIRHATID